MEIEVLETKLLNLRKSYRLRDIFDVSHLHVFEKAFQNLRSVLLSLPRWEDENILKLIDIIKNSYDTSNEIYAYFRSKDYNFQTTFEVCLKIRMICSQLLQILIIYLNNHDNILVLINYKTLYMIAFEILVLTTRMCLDSGVKHLIFAKKTNQQTKLIINNIGIKDTDVNYFLFRLNDLQIAHYQLDSKFHVESIKDKIALLLDIQLPQYQFEYEQYIKWIMMQIAVKLLKQQENIEWMYELVPQKQINIIKGIYSPNDFNSKEASNMTGLTTVFYEFYIEYKENGLSRITDEKLSELLSQSWNSRGYFEVLAQNYQISINPLLIWFNCYNNSFRKSTQASYYNSALKYFIFLVQNQQSQNSKIKAESMFQLIKSVLQSIVQNKKTTDGVINAALKNIVILIRQLVISDFKKQEDMMYIFELTKKCIQQQGFLELNNDLIGIQMFYLLAQNSSNKIEQFYRQQYLKKCTQQSDLKYIITSAYQSITRGQITKSSIQIIKKQPALSYLFFRSKGIKAFLLANEGILNEFQDIFDIFSQAIQQEYDVSFVPQRLISYLEKSTIQYSEKLQNQLNYLIKTIATKAKTTDINSQCLYDFMLCAMFCEIFKISKKLNISQKSINHNKFYKMSLNLQQIIQKSPLESQLQDIGLSFLSSAVPKSIIYKNNGKQPLFQIGQYNFFCLIQKFLLKNVQSNHSALKIIMFQLKCLNQKQSQLLEQVSKITQFNLLNLYFNCSHIPSKVMLQLLRKIIFLGVSSNNSLPIGIHHLKQAILNCTDTMQRTTYAKQLLYLYEEDGKKFLQIISERYPQIKGIFKHN